MVLLHKRCGAVVAKANSYKQIKQKVIMLTQWYKGAEMSLCAFYKPPFKNSPYDF